MRSRKILELVVLGMLGAVTFAAKLSLASLPNIEPVSLFVTVYACVFGWKALYSIYVYVMLEMMIWGIGLWNLNYFYIWTILFLVSYCFRKIDSPLGWGIISGGFGLIFGLLCTPVYCITGGWAFGLSWWVSGIPFDIIHCAGNFVLAVVLHKPLVSLLTKLRRQAGLLPQ